jgi:hypothetical protein
MPPPTDYQIRSYHTLSPVIVDAEGTENKKSTLAVGMAKGQPGITFYLIYLVAIATLGPAQFGYHLVSRPLPVLYYHHC